MLHTAGQLCRAFLFIVVLSALTGGGAVAAPTIAGLSPTSGPVGTSVTITGTNFGSFQGPSWVGFNGASAPVTSWGNTQIVVPVPNISTGGSANVVVTVGGAGSNAVSFNITATPPAIASLSPSSGPVGTSVTITGTNFGSYQGPSWVGFNGSVAPVTSWSNTQIVVPVPNIAAGNANVVVTVGGVASNMVSFNIMPVLPSMTGLSPTSGPVGTAVTITGTNFGSFQGSSWVGFNGSVAPVTSWSNTQIVVPVPNIAAGNANVVVTVGGVASSAVSFNITPTPPVITNLSPTSGATGTSVTVTGTNFGAPQGSSILSLNGTALVPVSWSSTQIVFSIPPGATTGNVVVTVNGLLSNGVNFTVASAAPSITGLSPTTGSAGAPVTISGANFGATQGTSTVTFNGAVATPTSWTSNGIVVPVPAGATTGNVAVQVAGAISNGVGFTVVAPPSITATVTPAPNANGWNNSVVQVAFNCTAGGLSLATCPSSQDVVTDGTNQIVTAAATDISGGSTSASVTLNIERTPPSITVSSPVDQSVLDSASTTVTGTVTASLTPVTGAACNGAPASFSAGSFSCNISLVLGVNLVMVTATDYAGNTAGTRLHLVYSAALPAPASLQITPATANLLVGDTQDFTVVDEAGRPRTDATWTVDNANIATITTDSSPTLTGVTSGTVTLTASVQGVSTQTQANVLDGTVPLVVSPQVLSAQAQASISGGPSLPIGTVLWSAPAVPGFTTQRIIQAVPTPFGTPDLYALDMDAHGNYLVRGFSANGQQLWQTPLPSTLLTGIDSYNGQAMGDSSGGLLLFGSSPTLGTGLLLDLDGQSGAIAWQNSALELYVNANGSSLQNTPALSQDGSVLLQGADQTGDANGGLLKIDPDSGQSRRVYSAPATQGAYFTCVGPPPAVVVSGYYSSAGSLAPPIVDADGNALFTAQYSTVSAPSSCIIDPTVNLFVKVAPNGGATTMTLRTPEGASSVHVVSPDGSGGALISWWTGPPAQPTSYTTSTTSGTTYLTPLNTINPQPVLGEMGGAFLTDSSSIVMFDPLSGSVRWTYKPVNGVASLYAAAAGGVTLLDGAGNQIAVDINGNAAAPVPGNAPIAPWTLGSWVSISTGYLRVITGLLFDLGLSGWPMFQGSSAATNSVQLPSFAHFLVENPLNPQTNYSVQSFKSDMLSRGYLPSDKANHEFYFTQDATLRNFRTSANKRENAVAFIGHSIEDQSNGQSLGIKFTDLGLVKTGYTYTIPVRRYNVFPTTARILFFGSCNDSSVFESLWGIKDNQNNGRAIIVPDSPNQAVHLDWAAKAWLTIATLLGEGKDVDTAVKAGNDYLKSQNLFGNSWKAVGDHNAKIVF